MSKTVLCVISFSFVLFYLLVHSIDTSEYQGQHTKRNPLVASRDPKSPPKRSDYKVPTDKFVFELGSPPKGIVPPPTYGGHNTGDKPPATPEADLEILETSSNSSESEDSVEIPLKSDRNIQEIIERRKNHTL